VDRLRLGHMTTGVAVFATAIGPCAVAWGENGICGVQLPERSEAATTSRLLRLHPRAVTVTPPPDVQRAIDRITNLLAGEADDLRDIGVDLGSLPEFNRRVYDVARSVGPGQTTTYGEIATRLGAPHASRDVGQALGRNPVPLIVPCHRVLAAGGKLGGFSAQGGVTTKLRLLDIEGAAPNGQPSLFSDSSEG
jgi:methylated-DNA-[protein]-cysteine S-methyltransferase